jgi:hypothetical protein
MMNPPVERVPNPDRPLHLIVEFPDPDRAKSVNLKMLANELETALGRKVIIEDLESKPRHARLVAISDSKVVYT